MSALLHNLVNGQISETISVLDRGFLYGDGVFETIRVHQGKLVLWPLHRQRLVNSCQLLGIALNLTLLESELFESSKFEAQFEGASSAGIVKIIVSRGAGGRGYQPDPAATPTRVIQVFNFAGELTEQQQQGIEVVLCQHRISSNAALSGLKHLNRLDQVLASRELDSRFFEGIVRDCDDQIIEGTRSNLFAVCNDKLITPRLDQAGVAGIMRACLLQRFAADDVAVVECRIDLQQLCEASEIFLCNSVFGIWPVNQLHENANVHQFPVGAYARAALDYQHEIFTSGD